MARQEALERVSNRTAMAVLSKKLDDLHAYFEQLCPTCNAYQPRFFGSDMAKGKRSQFTQCKNCRNGQVV